MKMIFRMKLKFSNINLAKYLTGKEILSQTHIISKVLILMKRIRITVCRIQFLAVQYLMSLLSRGLPACSYWQVGIMMPWKIQAESEQLLVISDAIYELSIILFLTLPERINTTSSNKLFSKKYPNVSQARQFLVFVKKCYLITRPIIYGGQGNPSIMQILEKSVSKLASRAIFNLISDSEIQAWQGLFPFFFLWLLFVF